MGEEYTRFWFSAREVRFRAELLKLVSFARTKRAGLHSDPLDDLVLLVFEQVSRLYLGYISAISWLLVFEQVSRHVRARLHVAVSANVSAISRRRAATCSCRARATGSPYTWQSRATMTGACCSVSAG